MLSVKLKLTLQTWKHLALQASALSGLEDLLHSLLKVLLISVPVTAIVQFEVSAATNLDW